MSLDFYYDHWFPLYFVPAPMLRKCDYYSLANFLFNRYTNPSDDERARERRILAFNRCNLSGLLGMRPFDSKDKARKKEDKQIIGMLFATAANFSSLIPLQAVLETFERVAAETSTPSADDLSFAFAFLVFKHVYTAGRPREAARVLDECRWPQRGARGREDCSVLRAFRNALPHLMPLAFPIFSRDFVKFGSLDQPRDVRRAQLGRLLTLARNEAGRRVDAVEDRPTEQFTMPECGVTIGACPPHKRVCSTCTSLGRAHHVPPTKLLPLHTRPLPVRKDRPRRRSSNSKTPPPCTPATLLLPTHSLALVASPPFERRASHPRRSSSPPFLVFLVSFLLDLFPSFFLSRATGDHIFLLLSWALRHTLPSLQGFSGKYSFPFLCLRSRP